MAAALQQRVFRNTVARNFIAAGPGLIAQKFHGLLDQLLFLQVIDHQIYAQCILHRLPIEAGVTTGNDEFRLGIDPLQPPYLLARLAIRLGRYRTGVEHDNIGICGIGGNLMTEFHELAGPAFEFSLV